jgi:glycerol-3-phosphate acyltransferase PlsY
MKFAILTLAAYLLGSIPFAFILAKVHGKDLYTIGSGNIGATNLARAIGKKWGYLCFALDVCKGLTPMLIARLFIESPPDAAKLSLWLLVGIAAILGHIFPVYLKFKGGKGVATSLGVALGVWPYFTICGTIAFMVWIVVVLIFRYVSLASITGAAIFPVVLTVFTLLLDSWQIQNLWPLFIAALAIPAVVIFFHRSNIKRLLAGTENKINKK